MAHNRQEGDPVRDPRQRIKLYDLQDFLLELARSPERAKMPLEVFEHMSEPHGII